MTEAVRYEINLHQDCGNAIYLYLETGEVDDEPCEDCAAKTLAVLQELFPNA